MLRRLLLCLFLAVPAATNPVTALEPGEALKDPALEARARAISRQLRCLVCQNQSIDDSDAPLARDLRRLVRERIEKGDSDAQVLAWVRARYGDFVMLRPPVRPATYLLWFGPALLLLAVAGVMFWRRRRGAAVNDAPLSPEEEVRLARLLEQRTDSGAGSPGGKDGAR